MMRALVTGTAGFVGSAISRRLLATGYEVVGIDAMTDYYDVSIKEANLQTLDDKAFSFVRGDINEVDLAVVLQGVDYVFHQAGQPGVRKSWGSDFQLYLDANVLATQKLLEASRHVSTLKKFVYASSSSLYGDAERFPTTEKDLPKPLSPYGVTKLAAEHLCSLYAANFGVPTTSLRYFTVYGPGQRTDMAFTRFCRAAVRGEKITIYGDGEQVRDFTYVDDIVRANIAAATSDSAPGSVFNAAGGSNISVNDVLDIITGLHGSPLDVEYIAKVAGDVRRTGGSTAAITAELGWTAQTPLEEGLRRQFEWARTTFGTL
jgi:UDP-glucuronate 4-epimerase